jgi:SAM-dependent methyltransferase
MSVMQRCQTDEDAVAETSAVCESPRLPGLQSMLNDVPSPIDLRVMHDAREWEETALSKRPWRPEFFEAFAAAIRASGSKVHRVLELGSGPGFLAEHLLSALPSVEYVALDFSSAMHELAAKRLGLLGSRVRFVERSFREPAWPNGLGQFECIVTNQAVHELRHKRYAAELHQQARSLFVPGGVYLVCDHFAGDGGMKNEQLYMSVAEQAAAMASAGFSEVEQVLLKGGMVLHRAA